jgi:hypothetical protein
MGETTDYFETSQKISTWFRSHNIKFIIHKDAPVVVEWKDSDERIRTPRSLYGGIGSAAFMCPYFGPGGEGNSMNALDAYVEKIDNFHIEIRRRKSMYPRYILWCVFNELLWPQGSHPLGRGYADWEALHWLLMDLMEKTDKCKMLEGAFERGRYG